MLRFFLSVEPVDISAVVEFAYEVGIHRANGLKPAIPGLRRSVLSSRERLSLIRKTFVASSAIWQLQELRAQTDTEPKRDGGKKQNTPVGAR
jgi:hypothetical protein